MAGRRTWLEPGKTLEVGRMEFSDFVFPHDPQMSSRHFAIECDGASCVIHDLRSSNGTFVNNERIESRPLSEGDEILAGQTLFSVRFEKVPALAPTMAPTASRIDEADNPTLHSLLLQQTAAEAEGANRISRVRAKSDPEPAPAVSSRPRGDEPKSSSPDAKPRPRGDELKPSAPEVKSRQRANDAPGAADRPTAQPEPPRAAKPVRPPAVVKPVLKEPFEWPIDVRNFRPDPGNYTFAVIDAAAAPELIEHARKLGMDLRCLLPDAPEPLARVAPYLVQIASKSNFFHHWADSLGRSAGVLLESPERLEPVFDHCRNVFLSHTDEGQNCFFRFYDPRVLRPYLPTCTLEELARFFGATHAIVVEDDPPTKLLRFTPSNAGLRLQVLKVDPTGPAQQPTAFAY